MFSLKGRVAVVSGASSGLGQQMALAFARQGASLVILARRMERLEEFKPKLIKAGAEKVLALKCDVTSTEDIDAAAEAAEKEFGKVDILLNCAGSSKDKGVVEMTDEEWDFTIATDETSVFKMTRAFAKIPSPRCSCSFPLQAFETSRKVYSDPHSLFRSPYPIRSRTASQPHFHRKHQRTRFRNVYILWHY